MSRNPWRTEPYFGPVFEPKPTLLSVDSAASPFKPWVATRAQPHPHAFADHPAHTARAKWLEVYERRRIEKEESRDIVKVAPRKMSRETKPIHGRFDASVRHETGLLTPPSET